MNSKDPSSRESAVRQLIGGSDGYVVNERRPNHVAKINDGDNFVVVVSAYNDIIAVKIVVNRLHSEL